MEMLEVSAFEEIAAFPRNAWGIPEPPSAREGPRSNLLEYLRSIDDCPPACLLTILPGVAFDLFGGRLGHGRGYYDAFMSALHRLRKESSPSGPSSLESSRTESSNSVRVHSMAVAFDEQLLPSVRAAADSRAAAEWALGPLPMDDSDWRVPCIITPSRLVHILCSEKATGGDTCAPADAPVAASVGQAEQVKLVGPHVIRVAGCNPGFYTLSGTNTYLIGTAITGDDTAGFPANSGSNIAEPCSGSQRPSSRLQHGSALPAVLVDTADGNMAYEAALRRAFSAWPALRPGAVVLTHRHPDHVGGLTVLARIAAEAAIAQGTQRRMSAAPCLLEVSLPVFVGPVAAATLGVSNRVGAAEPGIDHHFADTLSAVHNAFLAAGLSCTDYGHAPSTCAPTVVDPETQAMSAAVAMEPDNAVRFRLPILRDAGDGQVYEAEVTCWFDEIVVGDGDVLSLVDDDVKTGLSMRFQHTPGHTQDSISLYLHPLAMLSDANHAVEDTSSYSITHIPSTLPACFCGDTILGQGSTVFTDLTMYMQSLHAIRDQQPSVLYPGHGSSPIVNAMTRINACIEHRQARERDILKHLDFETEGRCISRSAHELTALVYAGEERVISNPSLFESAVHLTKMHCHKLVDDGILDIDSRCTMEPSSVRFQRK
jgi:glyoxylase-like metal-dependent hydrolase (beta-lactamase superfamily II)/5-formyltetrahydrofolate cyclo-ligase